METKKEEAIRKAYGEYWGRLPKKIKEEIFLLDGWLDWLSLNDISLGLLWFEIRNSLDANIDSDNDRLRPKTLQGIENNNGWIRIESEEDLPTLEDDSEFWIANENEIFNFTAYSLQVQRKWENKTLSHYQPIVKPEKPIC